MTVICTGRMHITRSSMVVAVHIGVIRRAIKRR